MHTRKGSLSFGLWPARSRAGTRWTGLLIFMCISVLLLHRSSSNFWFLPSPPSIRSCSTYYPDNYGTATSSSFYETVIQHHPVVSLAQLPFSAHGRVSRTQYDFGKDVPSYREAVMRKRRRAAIRAAFKRYWSLNQRVATRDGKMQQTSEEQKFMFLDSLETFWVMGMTKEFEEAIAVMMRMDLTSRDQVLSLLQTTRLLSVLLSAHDLRRCGDRGILDKAKDLGNLLYTFFDTPNRVPMTSWNSTKVANGEEQPAPSHATLTELTAYYLAFTRLSQLTGDRRFYDAVERVSTILASQQNSTRIPGLWPADMDFQSFNLTSDNVFNLETTSSPGAYAQLTLMTHLLGVSPRESLYGTMSTKALDAIIQHLLFRPITPTNASILMASSAYRTRTGYIARTHTVDASSCGLGGTLALAAALTRNETYLAYARLVTEGCLWATWNAPPSRENVRMMPTSFSMLACSSPDLSESDQDCSFDATVWPKQEYPGFETIDYADKRGVRPEVVMSLFTLYRVTGEEKWRDVGWRLWEGVERAVESLEPRRNEKTGTNDEEFRKIVQTMKHFYLLFGETDRLSLDEWVLGGDGGVLWAGHS